MRFSAEILSPYGGFLSQSGFLGIPSLFLMILLNHLPQEIHIIHLFGVIRTSFAFSLLGYISDASYFFNFSISAMRICSSQIPSANKACPGRIHQIFVHFEISHLPGGLGHLADSNSISKNPTATYHPIQVATVRLMSLLLPRRAARSAIPLVSERQSVDVR